MAVDADFRPEPGPYAVAVLATFAAVLIRWLLDPMLGDGYPLALVFAALALAVYIGGIGPAVVALLLGYLLSNFLFIEPRGVLSIGKPREEIAVPLYLLGGGMIMYLGDAARRARRRAERLAVLYREAERETQRLNVELNARIRELDTLLEVLPVGVLICERGSDEYRGNPAAFQLMGATGVPRGPVAALKSAPAEAFIARASVNGRPASLDELPLARAFNRGESIHNFRFDADAPPTDSLATLRLHRFGALNRLRGAAPAPAAFCPADTDLDGVVTSTDISAYLTAWLAGLEDGTLDADFNDDGAVNSSDISAFLTGWLQSVQNGTLEADFNFDGQVNSSDISAFLTGWLAAVQGGC